VKPAKSSAEQSPRAGFIAVRDLAKMKVDHCMPVGQIRDLMTSLPDLPRIPMGKRSSFAARATTLTPLGKADHVHGRSSS
jgi:hypothetical protein